MSKVDLGLLRNLITW